MNLEMVSDPVFKLTNSGWCFESDGKNITTNIMINSVLDSPKIKSVDSPIVKNMLSNDLIKAIHDDWGISTKENGIVISDEVDQGVPIALLGRLVKGTIIGVDAILECFGTRPKKWSLEAANRHFDWREKQ